MLKDGGFLRGLGFGLILASLLAFIMQSAQSIPNIEDNQNDGNQIETEEDLVAVAEQLGFQVYSASEEIYTKDDLEKAVEQASNQLSELEQKELEQEVKSFYITYRMTTTEVAAVLADLGLIDPESQDDFINQMKQNQLTASLQVGAYTFRGTPTMEEIMTRITSRP